MALERGKYIVAQARYDELLEKLDQQVENYRSRFKSSAVFLSGTRRGRRIGDIYPDDDAGNRNWATAASIIGDLQKDHTGREDKISLARYRYRAPKGPIPAKSASSSPDAYSKARMILRGIARLYAFLAPTLETLELCRSLCGAPEAEEYQSEFVVGTLLFATTDAQSRGTFQDLVQMNLIDVMRMHPSSRAISEYGRFGVVTAEVLRALFFDGDFIRNLTATWVARFGAVPFAAWLSIDAVSGALVPQKATNQGAKRRGTSSPRKYSNVSRAQHARWLLRRSGSQPEGDLGMVLHQLNSQLAAAAGVRGAIHVANVVLDSVRRSSAKDRARACFWRADADALTWSDGEILPLRYHVADADIAGSPCHEDFLSIRGLSPADRAYLRKSLPDATAWEPIRDPLEFALELKGIDIADSAAALGWQRLAHR